MNETIPDITSVVWGHFSDISMSLGTHLSMKVVLSFATAISAFFFGVEHNQILGMLLALTVIDMVTGMIATWKSGFPIENRKTLKSATKVAVYGLLVSATFLTEKIVPGVTFIDEAIISFLALTELVSILENIGTAGYAVPMKLLNRLKELREQDIKDKDFRGREVIRDTEFKDRESIRDMEFKDRESIRDTEFKDRESIRDKK